jgi:cytochrome b involved in lipid metabolism
MKVQFWLASTLSTLFIIAIVALACGSSDNAFTPKSPGVEATNASSTAVISREELARHNSAASCWVIVEGLVYDITSFVPQHSGSADVLFPLCGKDATQAWKDKGGVGRSHSPRAQDVLQSFRIGVLGQ